MRTSLKDRLAIATGTVSAAAVPMGADAGIVFKDSSNAFSVSYAGPYTHDWNVDGTGGSEFRLVSSFGNAIFLDSDGLLARGMIGNGSEDNFRALNAGFAVGPTLAAYAWGGAGQSERSVMFSNGIGGDFSSGKMGSNFIGFRFLSGTDTLYAWAEITLATTGGGTVTVNRWAYESTADCAINVGQTSGDNCPASVPAPPTLALLVAGAFGIRRWRRMRAAA